MIEVVPATLLLVTVIYSGYFILQQLIKAIINEPDFKADIQKSYFEQHKETLSDERYNRVMKQMTQNICNYYLLAACAIILICLLVARAL